MITDCQVVACHDDHAGKAHLTVRHGSGAEIALQHIPFESRADDAVVAEQAKILAQAADPARDAAEFLAAEAKQLRGWPTHAVAPGPSAGAGEAPNVFGQPIPRGCPIPAL